MKRSTAMFRQIPDFRQTPQSITQKPKSDTTHGDAQRAAALRELHTARTGRVPSPRAPLSHCYVRTEQRTRDAQRYTTKEQCFARPPSPLRYIGLLTVDC